jgi:predicted acyltransferase
MERYFIYRPGGAFLSFYCRGGMLAGTLILSKHKQEYKVMYLSTIGFITAIVGVVWNLFFPLIENLWTSLFVLFTSGMAAMTLAASIFIIDMLQYKKLANFGIIYDSNAITVYVMADIFALLFYGIKIGGQASMIIFLITSRPWALPPR